MSPGSTTWRRRRLYMASAVALFLLCAALRIGLADRHGLWADELFSLAMATGHSLEHPANIADASSGDFVELPQAVAPDFYGQHLEHDSPPANPARVTRAVFLSDTSPPGYYILLYLWTLAAGTSDLAVRGFSLIWALAAFPIVWSIARRLGGRRAAVATGFLYACSPLCVFYSVEGRMYSLLWFWTTCLIWLSLRLHRHDRGRGLTLAAWLAVSVAGFLTHYFFLFVWAAAVLWLLIQSGRLRRGWVIVAAVLTVALIIPWYLRLPASLANWRVTGNWLEVAPWPDFSFVKQALLLPWQYLSVRGVWGLRERWDYVAASVFLSLAVLFAVRRLAGRRLSRFLHVRDLRWCSDRRQLLWLTVAAACLGPVAFDLLRGTYVLGVPRYAIAGMPAAFVLVGIALGRFGPVLRALFMLAILGMCLVGIRRMYLNEGRMYEPTRLIAQYVAAELEPGELVIVHSIPSGVAGMARYIEQYRPHDAPPPAFAAWVGQLGRRQMPDDLLELIAGRRRVTIILVHEVGAPAEHVDWLRENATLDGERKIETIRVFSFVPRNGGTF